MSEGGTVEGSRVMGSESRWQEIARQFATARIPLAALGVLLMIVLVATFAPLISPQNPYDLNAIDVRDGRLPPGSPQMTSLTSVALRAQLPADGGEADLSSSRTQDAAFLEDLKFSLVVEQGDLHKYWLSLDIAQHSKLTPLRELTVSGLPRGSQIPMATKDRFRPRWTIPPALAGRIAVMVPRNITGDFRLRLGVVGGHQEHLMTYWLGTDAQGRDMLSAIFYGLRISLAVALTSVVIALVIGTLVGLFAAYFGGRLDSVTMRLVDLQLSFPTILVALILVAVLGKGVGNVMLALIIVQWAFYARTARGVALAERQKEYIAAGQCLALSTPRVVLVHLLPNCLPSLLVVATLQVAGAISLEATLSFLGLGLPVTQPSLGLLIANGFEYLMSGYPWISIIPGFALLITVVSINLIGDELRDILNPRLNE